MLVYTVLGDVARRDHLGGAATGLHFVGFIALDLFGERCTPPIV
jgi:hypothetical protein